MAWRAAAGSATERGTTPSVVAPAQPSPMSGPWLTRARVGLRPTRPHSLAGMRIEPPPSLACAIGTSPGATAAGGAAPRPPVVGARAGTRPGAPRGPRAAARPAGGVRRVPGVAGRRVAGRLGGHGGAELG